MKITKDWSRLFVIYALISSFGLAGCDSKEGFAEISNQFLSQPGSNRTAPMKLVIWPGTLVSAGGRKLNVFGNDHCSENARRQKPTAEDLSNACIVITSESESVNVSYTVLSGSRLTYRARMKETWRVERIRDALVLRTAAGELISPASLSGSPIEGVQFRAYEGS